MLSVGKILITFGSLASIGFGVWHFFVPRVWNWYSYINQQASELILAVRAINVFFSLSLVLFGLMNMFLVLSNKTDRYSLIVVLSATSILWLSRIAMQLIFPQGTIIPILQYAMLVSFILITLCYLISLWILVSNKAVL